MGTNENKKWYAETLNICFDPRENVSEAAFLKVFAAAMCIPCSANYGKTLNDRKSGAAVSGNRRSPADVWSEQKKVLEAFKDYVSRWEPGQESLKQRLNDLGDNLIHEKLKREADYAKKNSNYKPQNYLSLYLNATESSPNAVFQQVGELYGSVLAKVFEGREPLLEKQLPQLRERLQSKAPRCNLPIASSDSAQMGWYVSALLLLDSAETQTSPEKHDLLYNLLGIAPPEPGATLSVLSVEHITLKAGQFNALCAAALRAELELRELHVIHQVLAGIRKKVDGHLDTQTRSLVQMYMDAVRAFGERKSTAICNNWLYATKEENEVKLARELYQECAQWLG